MSHNLILFDDHSRQHLLPFTYTRPVAEIRCGIITIREKWELYTGLVASHLTENYLSEKFPIKTAQLNLLVNGSLFPDDTLLAEILSLKEGQSLWKGDKLLATNMNEQQLSAFTEAYIKEHTQKSETASTDILYIEKLWDIFSLNDQAIRHDYTKITSGRTSQPIPDGNNYINKEYIFIEEGARVQGAFLNASTGPIYIGKDSEIMEGTLIRGPFALCEHAGTKLATKVYGATTIGPHCKVGGEVNNVVMFSYSNKGHDGFLGNAVIGEWCNIGADTNNSNLKNNYAAVKLWSHVSERFENTGLTFCGLMMADHAKCGINTMFNTGTVVGVAANIFGAGFPRNFIPAFAWGGAQGFDTFQIPKVYEMAEQMSKRRNITLSDIDKNILKHIYETTATQRFWEQKQ
jgi:UDP-N-acetylglucosamine diphosphorylase/glucosamine-1-phosphate N-acetyltransferase